MAEPFKYCPLIGKDIRVLRVDPLELGESDLTPIRINMKHVDTRIHEFPLSFWAVSYVWASTDSPQTVFVNGAPLEVTANLYAALVEYRRRFLGDQWSNEAGVNVLWIDAICINQGDIQERSLQVPRMTEIYGRCERVFAWLGPVAQHEEAEVALLAEILAGSNDEAFTEVWEELPQEEQLRGRLRKALAILGVRPWFHRVWILQEFVLSAKPPVLVCGRHAMDFWKFIGAWNLLVRQMLEFRGIIPHVQWTISPNAYSDIKASRSKREAGAHAGVASELLTFLDQASKLRATQAHDQIYALLGLVSDLRALPPSLTPDYDKPYATVFHEYTAFLLCESGDTRVLMFGPLGAIQGVPSWVPDLRNRTQMEVAAERAQKPHFTVSPDSRTLFVRAISLGRVTHTFPSQGQLAPRENDTQISASVLEIFRTIGDPRDIDMGFLSTEARGVFPASAFKAFEEAIIAPATQIKRGKFEDVLRTWQRFRLPRMFGNYWEPLEPIFNLAYEAMKNGTTAGASMPETSPLWDTALMLDQVLRLAKIQDMLLGEPQFTLGDGQTGHLPAPPGQSPMPTGEVGDVVVALSGCEHAPFLVRGCGEGSYKLVSAVALDQYPQGLNVDHDVVNGFRSSFEAEARGDHTRHSVVKLDII